MSAGLKVRRPGREFSEPRVFWRASPCSLSAFAHSFIQETLTACWLCEGREGCQRYRDSSRCLPLVLAAVRATPL